MIERRRTERLAQLCSGPGKLSQALGIDIAHNGIGLDQPPFQLLEAEPVPVATGRRIGITRNIEAPWRFGALGSRFVSRRFP